MKTPCKLHRKQPTPAELTDSLLEFIQARFYPGHAVAFAKDKPRILAWVILWPATWLYERGVTLTTDRYGQIIRTILLDALAHANPDAIKYLPAWMRQTLQSHFAHHGDEIYDEAKQLRTQVEHLMADISTRQSPVPDLARDLIQARKILTAGPRPKPSQKSPVKAQLTLL